MPEFENAVGIPRSAAIEYPFGRPLGMVEDKEGQKEVLLQSVMLLETAKEPGTIKHLSFVWPEEAKDADWHPPEISPIIKENLEIIRKMKV